MPGLFYLLTIHNICTTALWNWLFSSIVGYFLLDSFCIWVWNQICERFKGKKWHSTQRNNFRKRWLVQQIINMLCCLLFFRLTHLSFSNISTWWCFHICFQGLIACLKYCKLVWKTHRSIFLLLRLGTKGYHSFSTFAKLSEKLTFLTPWYAHARVPIKG